MKHITAYHMQGFVSELEKQGGIADYGRKALELGRKTLGGHYGRQLALGAGLGAVGGAVTGDEENWRGRALKGALLGGGVAGGRILATKAGREALGRVGERALYTATGKGFKGRHIDLDEAKKLGLIKTPNFEGVADKPGMLEKVRAKVMGGPARSPLAQEANRYAAEVDAFNKGFHNVPGVLHGALTQPGQLLRSGWNRAGTSGKVFATAGLASAGHGMLKKPEEGGPGRLEQGLSSAGQTLGYMVAPGASLLPSMIGSGVIAGMGRKAGKAVGKVGDVAGKLVSRSEGDGLPEQGYYPADYGQVNPAEWR